MDGRWRWNTSRRNISHCPRPSGRRWRKSGTQKSASDVNAMFENHSLSSLVVYLKMPSAILKVVYYYLATTEVCGKWICTFRISKANCYLPFSWMRLLPRELDHPNLSKFIGGSIEVPYISIITDYCPKGSLSDVLLNGDIPINWGFRWDSQRAIPRAFITVCVQEWCICIG